MKLNINPLADGKYFNYWLHKNYTIQSIVTYDGKVFINGDFTQNDEKDIVDFYNAMLPFQFEADYMVEFLKGKYALNAERGQEYANEISAKIVMLIEDNIISLEEAIVETEKNQKTIKELRQGYYHSAYLAHVAVTPIVAFSELHEEIKNNLKEYINNHYPVSFHVV